jgi:hypothetical protein
MLSWRVRTVLKGLIAVGTLLLSGCSDRSGPGLSEKAVPRPTLAHTATAQKPTGPGLPRAKERKAVARDFKARVLEKR